LPEALMMGSLRFFSFLLKVLIALSKSGHQ
jgi:hypothetical protein